ncbi:MAG: hypothetical protein GZ094_03190 [Mariniphaga sp.]|nr:hypothetical protein [Mariniphaga sp.]
MENKFSPRKYLQENGRKLPIEKCLIADRYIDKGLTVCLIIRRQPGGKYTFANILVDRLCLGVKNSMVNCNLTEEEIDKMLDMMENHTPTIEVTSSYFHNLIYGAIDYASGLGIDTPKDFYLSEYVLDPDLVDDGIDEIEMGFNGKPCYIQGPYDNHRKIISALDASVGTDGYEYIVEV